MGRGLAIKAGFTAGGLVAAHLLKRRFPKLERPLTVAFGATSGFLMKTAVHNYSLPSCR